MPEYVKEVKVVVDVDTNYRTIHVVFDNLEEAMDGLREIIERLEEVL